MTLQPHNNMKTPKIGSISHGTMRPEDLVPAFRSAILYLDPENEFANDLPQFMAAPGYYESEASTYDLEDLTNILESLAPPYCYFGSHPGDGSDFGFWLPEDWRQQAEDDEVPIVSDASGLPEDYVCGPWVLINDHGNVTLYSRSIDQSSCFGDPFDTEIFAIV
jgi:hypothetical protein